MKHILRKGTFYLFDHKHLCGKDVRSISWFVVVVNYQFKLSTTFGYFFQWPMLAFLCFTMAGSVADYQLFLEANFSVTRAYLR